MISAISETLSTPEPVEVWIDTPSGSEKFMITDSSVFVAEVDRLYALWLKNYPKGRKDFCVQTRIVRTNQRSPLAPDLPEGGLKYIYKFGPDESRRGAFSINNIWYSIETNDRSFCKGRIDGGMYHNWTPSYNLKDLRWTMIKNMGLEPDFLP